MDNDFQNVIIGQDEAIIKIIRVIQCNCVGLKDFIKLIGFFIFFGFIGVGKMELAKLFVCYIFDFEDVLVWFDMSEYMEKFFVSCLIGVFLGYVGYEEGGQLIEKVCCKFYFVILLGEIEKVYFDVYNILFQVLDDGQLIDGLGCKVDFKNMLIIMIFNVGVCQLKDFGQGVGFVIQVCQSVVDDNVKGVI